MSRHKPETSWKAELERVQQVKQEVFDRIRHVEQKMESGSLDEVLAKMKVFNDKFTILEKASADQKYDIKSLTLRVQSLEKVVKDTDALKQEWAGFLDKLEAKLRDGLPPIRVQKLEKNTDKKHPWIAQWEQWVETKCPADGLGQEFPLADIIIALTKPKAILALHAKNGGHISINHFVKLVGHDASRQMWRMAEKQDVPGVPEDGMQLWITKEDDYTVSFAISPDQFEFNGNDSLREVMNAYFERPNFHSLLSSLGMSQKYRERDALERADDAGDAKGSEDQQQTEAESCKVQ